jgi:multiple sugar transport system substrate-binding protein
MRTPGFLTRQGARHLRAATAAALAAIALAACGGGTDSSGGEGGGGDPDSATLNFINAQDPGTFDKVIAGFNKENPNIKIKLQTVPFDDLNSTVQSRLGSRDPSIDLYDVDEPRLAAFAARGFLLDLSDLAEAAQGTVDEKALEATKYEGKQYSMPRWTSTQLLFFNRAVLEKAGVEAPSSDPQSPMTWEAVTAEGKKAQAGGAKYGLVFDQVDRYYQLQPLPESAGGGPGVTGDSLTEPDVTNDGWIKAFTWYASIFEDGISPRGITPEQTAATFSNGETAFFAGGPWNAPLFDEAKVDYGVAPFPMFEGGKPASSTGSWGTGISPFSKNQEAAKKFIEYMTINPTGATEATSRNIPVQQEARDTYLTEIGGGGERNKQLADIIRNELASNAVPRPTTVGFVELESTLNKAFADIRNGSDPAERLQQAQEELDRAFAKYQK